MRLAGFTLCNRTVRPAVMASAMGQVWTSRRFAFATGCDDRNGGVRAAFGERGFRDLQCHFTVFHQHSGAGGAGHGQPVVARWRWLAPAPPRRPGAG
jgi:hypothetical protein